MPKFPIRPNQRTPIQRTTYRQSSDFHLFPRLTFLERDNQDKLNKEYKRYNKQFEKFLRRQKKIKEIHKRETVFQQETFKNKVQPSSREKILKEKELQLESYKNFVKRKEIEIANKEKLLQLEKEKQQKFFEDQTKILEEQKQKNETEIQQQKKEFEEKKVREKRLRIVSAIFQLVVSKLNRFKYKFIKSRTF